MGGDEYGSVDDCDHRTERGQKWLQEGVARADTLRFLERADRSLAQAALAFVLSHTQVSSVVPGAKNQRQLRENLDAANLAPLAAEDLQRAHALYAADFAVPA
jgi:aryl-alcohol dehydrogenase-like predicted oxidoreductase